MSHVSIHRVPGPLCHPNAYLKDQTHNAYQTSDSCTQWKTKGIQKQSRKLQRDVKVSRNLWNMKHSHYIHHVCVEMCPPTVPFQISFGPFLAIAVHLNMHGLTKVQKARRNKSNINVLSTKPNQYLFLSWNSLTSMSTVKPMLML